MIAAAAEAVAPGGRLVYATCSSEPEENEEVVAAFLTGMPGFVRAGPDALVDAGVPPSVLDRATGDLQTRPDRHGLECFYASALERRA